MHDFNNQVLHSRTSEHFSVSTVQFIKVGCPDKTAENGHTIIDHWGYIWAEKATSSFSRHSYSDKTGVMSQGV